MLYCYPDINRNLPMQQLFAQGGSAYNYLGNYVMAVKDFTEAMKYGDPKRELQLYCAFFLASVNVREQDFLRDMIDSCRKFVKIGKTQIITKTNIDLKDFKKLCDTFLKEERGKLSRERMENEKDGISFNVSVGYFIGR